MGRPLLRRAGLSLIEMLIVMAAIAILAGLLLPAIGLVRAVAPSAACSSNLRQISLGINIYVQDWRGFLPLEQFWASGGEHIVDTDWVPVVDGFVMEHRSAGYAIGSEHGNTQQAGLCNCPASNRHGRIQYSGHPLLMPMIGLPEQWLKQVSVQSHGCLGDIVLISDGALFDDQWNNSSTVLYNFDYGWPHRRSPNETDNDKSFLMPGRAWCTAFLPDHRARAGMLFLDGHVAQHGWEVARGFFRPARNEKNYR